MGLHLKIPLQSNGEKVWKYLISVLLHLWKTHLFSTLDAVAAGVLSIFKDKGYVCKGTDFDNTYLDYGKSKGLDLNYGGIDTLSANEKFDLIILRHVLEHIPDPSNFLIEIKNLLNPDGKLYVEVPSLEYILDGGYNFDISTYFQNAHFIHFTTRSLSDLLKLNGFKIFKANRYIKALIGLGEERQDFDNSLGAGFYYSKSLMQRAERRRLGFYKKFFNMKSKMKQHLKKIIKMVFN